MINEEFLQFIWKFQLYNFSNLVSSSGSSILVLNPGVQNLNSGPDFFNAQIQIGEILWFGDVEVHVKSSGWLEHKHHEDDSYDAVVLHVVYEEDVALTRGNGSKLHCLVLRDLIPDEYLTAYDTLYRSDSRIPCAYALPSLDRFFWQSYTDRLLVERLENKQIRVREMFRASNENYQECFYRLLSYTLGLKVNKIPMLRLAEQTPLRLLQKHRLNRLQLEALLFGQSGMLHRVFKDRYPQKLKVEYLFFKEKYKLHPLTSKEWKFFRLRPSSFPSLRISYLADFVYKSELLFDTLFQYKSIEEVRRFFELELSDYWQSHYVFDKKSRKSKKILGQGTIDLIMINTILPFCFFYAKQQSNEAMMMRVLDSFRAIKYENNKIVRSFKEAGVHVKSALMSQALIHLHASYCTPRNCLNCRVFNQILK